MHITYLEIPKRGKRTPDRIFGCSYINYPMPNIFILILLALLKREGYAVSFMKKEIQSLLEFENFIKDDKSEVYLLYSVNLSKEDDSELYRIIRKIKLSSPVIFLGPAPTLDPDYFIKDKFTYVVRGEPELTILDLLKSIKGELDVAGIKGISYMKNSKIINNNTREILEDLDWLPFPDREMVDKNSYYNPKLGFKPFTAMLTSRGCAYRCIFCVPNSLSFARELEYKRFYSKKPPVRLRSADNVIEEFKLLKDKGYKSVSIIDDQFIWDKTRVIEICKGIKNLGIIWGCLSRIDKLDEETIASMSKSGCRYVDIGLESFCQDILDYVKKDLDIKEFNEKIGLLKKYKISVKLNVILGASPLETKDTINYTIKEINKLKPDQVMYSICSPFPGTELYNIAKSNSWFIDGDYRPVDVSKESIISYAHLTKLDLEEAVRKANFRFFFNIRFVMKNLLRIKNIISLKESGVSLLRKLYK